MSERHEEDEPFCPACGESLDEHAELVTLREQFRTLQARLEVVTRERDRLIERWPQRSITGKAFVGYEISNGGESWIHVFDESTYDESPPHQGPFPTWEAAVRAAAGLDEPGE